MYAAIKILEKALFDAGAMQSGPESSSYITQIQLAIKILKQYQDKMEKQIEKELQH